MNPIFSFLANHISVIINVGGVLLTLVLAWNYTRLLSHRNTIMEAVNRKNTNSYYNKNTGELEDRDISEAVTPDTIRNYERRFNADVSNFNAFSQIIPVFPLLGILGTVAGLIMLMMQEGVEAISLSMDVALRSTFWGLVWTIALKIFIALFSKKVIDDTEVTLEDYDKKFNNSYMQGNIVGNMAERPGAEGEKQ